MKKIKELWNEFLKRLAAENEELFQGKKPDCCSMNSKISGGKK
jgi:hypothetical protein